MKIVADESVDFTIIEMLRSNDMKIIAVVEEHPSISDDEVLQMATEHQNIAPH